MAADFIVQLEDPPPTVELEQFRSGILTLYRAWLYSQQSGCNLWEFAVEWDELSQRGLDRSDVRHLIRCGFAEHAVERVGPLNAKHRRFRPLSGLALPPGTCFVLTPAGVAVGKQLWAGATLRGYLEGQRSCAVRPVVVSAERPKWDAERRELRWGNQVIKNFRQLALAQETILATFEEDNWPPRIDDPLPPKQEQNTMQRLRDTVKNLNRHHRIRVLSFHCDGTGAGVGWRVLDGT